VRDTNAGLKVWVGTTAALPSEKNGATVSGNMHRKFDEIRTCGF